MIYGILKFILPSKWRVIATSEAEGKLLIPYANEVFKRQMRGIMVTYKSIGYV